LRNIQFADILKNKVEYWYELLHGSDQNYPVVQMREIARKAQFFRLFNSIIELRVRDDEITEVNYLLWSMLTQGYICCQVAAIRRMSEKQKNTPEKQVTSLRALIDDIKHFMVTYSDIKSEQIIMMYKTLEPDCNDELIAAIQNDPGEYRTYKDPKDLGNKFKVIVDELKECESVCEHMNKYIAHAATQDSRKNIKRLKYGDLYKAEKLIWNAYNSLRWLMFRDNYPINTSYSFDPIEYLDMPLVKKDEMEGVKQSMREIESEMTSWFSILDIA